MNVRTHLPLLLLLTLLLCPFPLKAAYPPTVDPSFVLQVGADHIPEILSACEGKQVGIATNATATLTDREQTHLVDTLLSRGVCIHRLYSPEHGLSGKADAGAKVDSQVDPKSRIPVISLYGKRRKPLPEDLAGIRLMIFDMQDVGCRFYTYISTLYYLLDACAEEGIPVLILDRPNPHDYIDGPVLKDDAFRSFVGMLPIPVLHGLTLGEAALMMRGEGWLTSRKPLDLTIVKVNGWEHGCAYSLPVAPSPNLRSDLSIFYYPTLCFLEGTSWSVGRGTDHPFEVVGYPDRRLGEVSFTPHSVEGAKNPPLLGKKCYGPAVNPYFHPSGQLEVELLLELQKRTKSIGKKFITRAEFFDKLAGTDSLRRQIENGVSAQEIRQGWKKDLEAYKEIREKYLLYRDKRQFYWE